MTTETLTLTAFLEARIAEDEAVALAASVGGWQDVKWPTPNDGWAVEVGMWLVADPQMEGDAHHIARHDPARVLATCKAHRAIVELHDRPHECSTYDHTGEVDNCSWCLDGDECSTLRALASIYADHPDYREEWAL